MATISNTPRPGYVWDSADNVWYPIGVGAHQHTNAADTPAVMPYSTYAAAGKNKIINGDFSVWQRGTSFTPAANAYTADRWEEDATTAYPTTQTISRQTFTPGTAPVAGYEGQYFLRFAYTYATGNGGQFITQKIENVQTFAGQTVTISFWAKAGSAVAMDNAVIRQNFGSGGSSTVQTTVGAASLTTSWQRFTFTVAVPSISGKTIGTNSFLELRLFMPATSSTTDIWGVQVEAGSTVTAFQTATGNPASELAACQRYYYRQTGPNISSVFSNMGWGSNNAQYVYGVLNMPVTMRIVPTSLDYSAVRFGDGTNFFAPTTLTILTSNTSESITIIEIYYSTGGLVQYRPYYLLANSNAAAYLGVSAEL